MKPIAILSALQEEQRGLIDLLEQPQKIKHAGRSFWLGDLHGQPVVLALSKIGKVAAATTATALIERFGAHQMLFTGVAGGLKSGINVGDLVVGQSFVQHDLDVSPLFPRYEVPFYGRTRFDGDTTLTMALFEASRQALSDPHLHSAYPSATVHLGLIASGDRFVSGVVESGVLRSSLVQAGHDVLAVEMECAAVAQVCHDYGVPFAAVRTISDRADDTAHVDFPSFVNQVASRYARAVVQHFLEQL
jgi:adenosylhomocysteine nucleosidase